jgi:hypothetical protein
MYTLKVEAEHCEKDCRYRCEALVVDPGDYELQVSGCECVYESM